MNHIRQSALLASALAAMLAGGTTVAATRPPQDAGHDQHQRKDQRQEKRAERRDAAQARRADRREVRQDRREDRREDRRDAVQAPRSSLGAAVQAPRVVVQSAHEDRREARQDRREDRRDWRQDRREDRQDARQDMQRRIAYARYRNDYDRRLRSVQVRIVPRYYARPGQYRYGYGGHWYTTSNYGAELLRMAVQNGYREGLRAGNADRYDRWPGGFRDSFAWRDGAYGYGPGYVSRADYTYYFRQGFERGYDDGYYGRMRYGRHVSGEAIIIDAVLGSILNLRLLR